MNWRGYRGRTAGREEGHDDGLEPARDRARPAEPTMAGEPLEATEREALEQSFATDLGQIRVHRDRESERLTAAFHARAFAKGRDIYFSPGAYGRRTLAHEVAHSLQQEGGRSEAAVEDRTLEAHAVQAADAAESGREAPAASIAPAAASPALQRDPLPGWEDLGTGPKLRPMPETITLDGFDSDQAELKENHVERLKELAEELKTLLFISPNSFAIVIGHTDATDSEKHNKALGQRRANAVRDMLVSLGVAAGALDAKSLGEEVLLVDTPGREPRNRRVEIYIYRRAMTPRIHRPSPPAILRPPEDPQPKPPNIWIAPEPKPHDPEEERREEAKRQTEEAKRVEEIRKQRAEGKLDSNQKSVSTFFGEKAEEFARKLGAPKSIQKMAREFGEDLPAKGSKFILDQIANEGGISSDEKEMLSKAIEAASKVKPK